MLANNCKGFLFYNAARITVSNHRKTRNLENWNRRVDFNICYERVNRKTSRDYNQISDTDFASFARYYQLRYNGSGARLFWKSADPLLWRCREFVDSHIFGLYNVIREECFISYFGGHISRLGPYVLITSNGLANTKSEGGKQQTKMAPDHFFGSRNLFPYCSFIGGRCC